MPEPSPLSTQSEETDFEPIYPRPPDRRAAVRTFPDSLRGRGIAIVLLSVLGCGILLFTFYYVTLARKIDRQLAAGAFADTVNIFSAPRTVAVGDELSPQELVERLRRSGFTTARGNTIGWYRVLPGAVEIFPGRDAHSRSEQGVLRFAGDTVSGIVSLQDHTSRPQFVLEPQLIANFSEQRERRRLVTFNEIPPYVVQAVVSVEDKRFFKHTGFDFGRIVKALYVDLKEGRKEQGASTITMQLARSVWLDPRKRWSRKLQELLITMHLEGKLTKQQIFEYYANQVYLGRRGTFSISGFGEAAHAFFGKDLNQLDLPEAATLAGLIQRPSYYNPLRYPERARDRRNVVLGLMKQNGYLTEAQYRQAASAPVRVSPEQAASMESQYFLDIVNDEVQDRLEQHEQHSRYIYTTLDPDLQEAAQEAVRLGMAAVDKRLKGRKEPIPPGQPQVALVAIDPRTGEVKALVGGRDYNTSQFNHAMARRQPGSVFKPFVYAAAMSTAIESSPRIFTPASVLDDSPTTFYFNRTAYQPGNFSKSFMGEVTVRTALTRSLNVVTVQLAQAIGLQRVVDLARRAGLNDGIQATPSVALGAYETTPLEIAGAYTVFANGGRRLTPTTISLVRSPNGTVLYQHHPDPWPALDARVNYLMVSMMQDVLRYGTGAGVRSRGFTQPAAGKTGTSHDGWFAGFTSELLCVVWVGFDDNRDLKLEGAHSALPIWTEFMKRASQMRPYRNAKPFYAPSGIVSEPICADSGALAGNSCPNVRSEVFISGTEPGQQCELHALYALPHADRVVDGADPARTMPLAIPDGR